MVLPVRSRRRTDGGPRREGGALSIDSLPSGGFLAALGGAGMLEGFSVARQPQVVPAGLVADIAGFIRVFDTMTGRHAWRAAAQSDAPAIAQAQRREVCFFSAWDFHHPPEGGFQRIEFTTTAPASCSPRSSMRSSTTRRSSKAGRGSRRPPRFPPSAPRSPDSSSARRTRSSAGAPTASSSSSTTRSRCGTASSAASTG